MITKHRNTKNYSQLSSNSEPQTLTKATSPKQDQTNNIYMPAHMKKLADIDFCLNAGIFYTSIIYLYISLVFEQKIWRFLYVNGPIHTLILNKDIDFMRIFHQWVTRTMMYVSALAWAGQLQHHRVYSCTISFIWLLTIYIYSVNNGNYFDIRSLKKEVKSTDLLADLRYISHFMYVFIIFNILIHTFYILYFVFYIFSIHRGATDIRINGKVLISFNAAFLKGCFFGIVGFSLVTWSCICYSNSNAMVIYDKLQIVCGL